MTINEWYQSRQGQSLLVPGADEADRGQCMQAWDYGLNEVYGQSYVWANAIDAWNKFSSFPQLVATFNQVTDGTIKVGDGVVFNTKVGSVYGHIDWALQDGTFDNFVGADSNWGGNKTLHTVTHTGAQYILGVLRPKEEEMPAATIQRGDVDALWHTFMPTVPNEEDYQYAVGKTWDVYVKVLMGDYRTTINNDWVNRIWSQWVNKKPAQEDYDFAKGLSFSAYLNAVLGYQYTISVKDVLPATPLKPGNYRVGD